MSIYKKAIQIKLRVNTQKGLLSVEQLNDLKQSQLATILKNLKKQIDNQCDDGLSFLDESLTQVNPLLQLQFDIVKDIYITKKDISEKERKEASNKLHNQKILEIIKRKQESKLEDKSIEELEKMLEGNK